MTTSGLRADARWPLPRGLIVVLSMTGLLVSVLALKQFAGIVAPVLLALILVISFHPLIGILRGRGVPQWLAVTITLLALIAVILGMAISLGLSVGRLATILPNYQAQFEQLANDLRAWLGSLGVGQDQVNEALKKINFSNVAVLLGDLLAGLAAVFSNLLLLLFVVAFMALDSVRFSRRLALARPERPEIVGALDSFVAGTRTYLLVSTIFGLIVAAIDTGFLWLVDVPLPVLWGMLAFITNYIPNVGFIIGIVPPALLGLLQGGPKLMVIVLVGYSLTNFVIQSIIQPKVMADAVNLSLTLTFVSLIFWTFVIGAIGRNSGRTADAAHESAAARRGPEHPVDVRPHHRRPRPARGCGGRRGDHPRRAEAGLGRSRLAGSRFGGRQPAGYRPRRRRVDPHS